MSASKAAIFGYYIDLDERGSFRADVRNADGETVFEVLAGDELQEGDSSIFEDGFMGHKNDLDGLTQYLRSLGTIPADANILPMADFEARLEEPEPEDEAEDARIFTVSVTYEVVTDESAEHGDAAERGYEIENEEMDYEDFCRLVQDRNYSEPSSSVVTDRMWFRTPDPEQSRAFFENGERKFYSLHLKAVDGESPTPEDYAEVARLAGAKVSDLDRYERPRADVDADAPSP